MAESWISVVRLSWHSGSIIEASWYYGKVDMGGMGSSTMELMGSVILLHVLRAPFFCRMGKNLYCSKYLGFYLPGNG